MMTLSFSSVSAGSAFDARTGVNVSARQIAPPIAKA